MQHISKSTYVVCWLNTGLYFIWPKYQHSNHMLMSSYVDCQCFRFYLREDSSLIIFQSMQHISTQPYEVGCSTRWSYFNWASMSTLKIKHSHPYTQILDFQFLDWGKLQSWSSASSESSSATSTVLPFVHEVPWQWPQASVHFRPFLRQVHLAEVQSVVQSHQMTLSSSGGAGGRSVNTGEYPESVSFQPHDSSCKLQWGFFHW